MYIHKYMYLMSTSIFILKMGLQGKWVLMVGVPHLCQNGASESSKAVILSFNGCVNYLRVISKYRL